MLYEMAKKQNTIICLGTGSGKTFIAIMLMKELAYQVRPPFDKGGKRTIMLVPIVVLVKQQADVIREQTDLTVGTYTGSMAVDKWTAEEWEREFVKNQVLVMTPDIFLKHNHLPLGKVNLLIFDEAHHATKNHPYNQIMDLFDVCPDPPRILGLSASLIDSKAKVTSVERSVRHLEKNLKCRLITAGDIKSVNKYGAQPSEQISYFTPSSISYFTPSSISCFTPSSILGTMQGTVESVKCEMKGILTFISDCDISGEEKRCLIIGRNAISALSDSIDNMGLWTARECASMCSRELAEVIAMRRFSNRNVALVLSCVKTLMDFTVTQVSKHLDAKDAETLMDSTVTQVSKHLDAKDAETLTDSTVTQVSKHLDAKDAETLMDSTVTQESKHLHTETLTDDKKTLMDSTVTQESKHLDAKTPLDRIIGLSCPKLQLLLKTLKSFPSRRGKWESEESVWYSFRSEKS